MIPAAVDHTGVLPVPIAGEIPVICCEGVHTVAAPGVPVRRRRIYILQKGANARIQQRALIRWHIADQSQRVAIPGVDEYLRGFHTRHEKNLHVDILPRYIGCASRLKYEAPVPLMDSGFQPEYLHHVGEVLEYFGPRIAWNNRHDTQRIHTGQPGRDTEQNTGPIYLRRALSATHTSDGDGAAMVMVMVIPMAHDDDDDVDDGDGDDYEDGNNTDNN